MRSNSADDDADADDEDEDEMRMRMRLRVRARRRRKMRTLLTSFVILVFFDFSELCVFFSPNSVFSSCSQLSALSLLPSRSSCSYSQIRAHIHTWKTTD